MSTTTDLKGKRGGEKPKKTGGMSKAVKPGELARGNGWDSVGRKLPVRRKLELSITKISPKKTGQVWNQTQDLPVGVGLRKK